MLASDYPTCIECLAPVHPMDDALVEVPQRDKDPRKEHCHEICSDFATFLSLNFKSSKTIRVGEAFQAFEAIKRMYAKLDIRDMPNAYLRAGEMHAMILRNRRRKK